MARIQLILSDEERDRFIHEARSEGKSLSEWLRQAAREQVQRRLSRQPFNAVTEITAFFERCDALPGDTSEPDWEQHLSTIEKSRQQGVSES